MEDIAEQREMAQEIADAISRPIGPGIDFDEVKKKQMGTDTIFLPKAYRTGTLFLVCELNAFFFWLLSNTEIEFWTMTLCTVANCALFLLEHSFLFPWNVQSTNTH